MSQVALKQIYGLVEKKYGKEYLTRAFIPKKQKCPRGARSDTADQYAE